MMDKKLRFAIIGLDHWYTAIDLAKTMMDHPHVELVGIADSQLERASEVANQIGLAEYTDDLYKYINDDSVDAIGSFITVDRNPEIVMAAAEAGKHIVSIKPFANTLEEGSAIVEAVRKAGVQFIPAESSLRVSELHQFIKEVIDQGRVGDVVSGNFTLTSSLPQNWPGAPFDGGWWTDPSKVPGGAWIDHAIYKVDRLRWFLGEKVVRVTGRTANLVHKDLGVEDYGHAIIEFESGATFTIEDTWSAPHGSWRNTSVLVGTKAIISHDTLSPEFSTYNLEGEGWSTKLAPPDGGDFVSSLVEQFTGTAETTLGTVEDAWENLAVCLAFYESAKTGKTVDVQHLN